MINKFAVIGVKMEGISKRGFGVPFLRERRDSEIKLAQLVLSR